MAQALSAPPSSRRRCGTTAVRARGAVRPGRRGPSGETLKDDCGRNKRSVIIRYCGSPHFTPRGLKSRPGAAEEPAPGPLFHPLSAPEQERHEASGRPQKQPLLSSPFNLLFSIMKTRLGGYFYHSPSPPTCTAALTFPRCLMPAPLLLRERSSPWLRPWLRLDGRPLRHKDVSLFHIPSLVPGTTPTYIWNSGDIRWLGEQMNESERRNGGSLYLEPSRQLKQLWDLLFASAAMGLELSF